MASLKMWRTIAWTKLVPREWEITPRGYILILAHILGFHGLVLLFTGQVPCQYTIFSMALLKISAVGVAAGTHRYYAHRSYKAKLPLRLFIMLAHTISGHSSIYSWARDHRLHHKYSETDADPHNSRRGLFFAHIGWIMLKEHPEVAKKEKQMDFSDLKNDPVVAIQYKYFYLFHLILFQAFQILVPYYLWYPYFYKCICINYLRFVISIHLAALGNSVAHTWTRKPYEKSIGPADISWLSLFIIGEGWHNFHHVFPWDYRSTDVGLYYWNLGTMFIDLMAKFGWAYDLKTVSDDVVRKRAARTGDGSYRLPAPEDNCGSGNLSNGSVHSRSNVKSQDSINAVCDNRISAKLNEQIASDSSLDKLNVGDIGPAPWGWGDNDISVHEIAGTLRTNYEA